MNKKIFVSIIAGLLFHSAFAQNQDNGQPYYKQGTVPVPGYGNIDTYENRDNRGNTTSGAGVKLYNEGNNSVGIYYESKEVGKEDPSYQQRAYDEKTESPGSKGVMLKGTVKF